jgi:hypothetical protein
MQKGNMQHYISDLKQHKKERLINLFIVLFFASVLIIGLCIYDDYGISTDEPVQRQHSLINYEYINQTLFGRQISYIQELGLPPLEDYEYKFYSMATQLPLVAMEDASGFTMTEHNIYLMRHLYTFLIYFVSLIFFFFLCKELFKSSVFSLAGTAMLYLFPRFFAESFYNIKDLMFVAIFIIALYCMIKVLKSNRRLLWIVLFSIAVAFATNTRIVGLMLLPVLLLFMLIEDIAVNAAKDSEIKEIMQLPNITGKCIILKRIAPYFLICIISIVAYFAITPASWQDPFGYAKSTLLQFSDYSSIWEGSMLFEGNAITVDKMPWYYIPVWMGITVPVFYLILFVAGTGFLVWGAVKRGIKEIFANRYMYLIFMLFLVPLLIFMIAHLTIYIGWRHVYFLFIPFLLTAIYGLVCLQERFGQTDIKLGKMIMPIVTVTALAIGGVRIIIDHPYQNAMFNEYGVGIADQYDRDYWALTYKDMIGYILQNNDGTIRIGTYDYRAAIAYKILTEEQRKRIVIVESEKIDTADFILDNLRLTAGNDYFVDGFSEYYSIWQDGYKIGTALKNNLS